jgi:hypothetical protein|eukprot:COSAG06_NODE_34_length_31045_cov_28.806469_37_plen_158_part_00
MQLPSVKKTYLMIPPPYQYLLANAPMTKCPADAVAGGCSLSAPCVDCQNRTRVSTFSHFPLTTYSHSLACWCTNRFNGTGGQGEPEKERAKACIINCVLPNIVRQVALELKLPAPVDMLSFFQFPGVVNKTLIPVLHPSCEGYSVMGQYIAKELFSS